MIRIDLTEKENQLNPIKGGGFETKGIDRALFRLRKKMEREGVIDDVKNRRYYQKPSDVKRKTKSKAQFRQMKRDEEWK